jgi:integrase/recombinase XerD
LQLSKLRSFEASILREAADGWDDGASSPHVLPVKSCGPHAVAKFAQYFKQSPDRLGLVEVRAYQIQLVETGTSWAVAVSALRFFYGVTLGRPAMVERIPHARKQQQLPIILSADEVVRFFAAVPSLKQRTALMAAYAAGLRVSEV